MGIHETLHLMHAFMRKPTDKNLQNFKNTMLHMPK